MGYLHQKKLQKRKNSLLNTIIVVFLALTALALCSDRNNELVYDINLFRWQYYMLLGGFTLLAFYLRFFAHASVLLLLFVFNSFLLSANANIFTNSPIDRGIDAKITYQYDLLFSPNIAVMGINSVAVAPDANVFIFDTEINYISTTVLAVNFRNIRFDEHKMVFDNLATLVLAQDKPVIVVGDFGIPAWSKTFREFLRKTQLEVKNRTILSDRKSFFTPFASPTLNFLAYKNTGLKNVDVLSQNGSGTRPIVFDIVVKN